MKPGVVLLILAGVALAGWTLYLLFGLNGKSSGGGRSAANDSNGDGALDQAPSNVAPRNLTKIIKNEDNKLSLVVFNSVTNEVLNSRILDFKEATQLTGGFSNVCLNPPNGRFGATGYAECSLIRGGQ